ncbi:Sybindin-like protein [Hypoxylon fragiforme]|uniref:Sybindin-like protein n=1 Tax=Hypoxylon fragiforme TaxID=63214 RepID=UPI0020C73E27|nr:Sybindin-like protein [Hypoxylon fragiforme]KAI2607638.1 Sybindin-like protein [Hypoxylon fragiforme]
MAILALIVINKAGGLIYNRTFGDGLNQLNTNDYLVLAGTFHGVHAITARVNPLKSLMYSQHQQTIPTAGGVPVPSRPDPPSGLEVLESENFRLQCFNTLTGTKFLLFTDNLQPNVDLTMHKVYDLYSDFVMKNPFYQLEMPIRCEAFERKLNSYIREINNSR